MGSNHAAILTAAVYLVVLMSSARCYTSFPPFTTYSPIPKYPGMKDLHVVHGWKTVDYIFPSEADRLAMLKEGTYIPGQAIVLDVDYWQSDTFDHMFVTMPRMKEGIPASLGLVTAERSDDGSPLIQPYPDWSWHRVDNCEGIISPFRTKMDDCGRLWVIDSGVVDILTSAKHVCPPKVMVFEAATGKLAFKHVFSNDVLEHGSFLVTIALDVRQRNCAGTHAYIADVTQFGLVVFDSARQHAWRVNHNYFYPFPLYGTFEVAGSQFDLMDGILGLALSPLDAHGDKALYFHSLASVRESKVSANLLRNESNFPDGENHVTKRFYITDEVRPSQSAAQDMSQTRVLFFGLLSQVSLACWNSRLPYTPYNLVTVAQNNETLQFPSGVKVVRKNGKEEVLVLTSRFPNYFLGTIDPQETNFRILSGTVEDLVRGTPCEVHPFPRSLQFIT